MRVSSMMDEIRKIRDENSLRHPNMTNEEISKEHNEAIEWLAAKLGKPIDVVYHGGKI
jgi:hypothetical protein